MICVVSVADSAVAVCRAARPASNVAAAARQSRIDDRMLISGFFLLFLSVDRHDSSDDGPRVRRKLAELSGRDERWRRFELKCFCSPIYFFSIRQRFGHEDVARAGNNDSGSDNIFFIVFVDLKWRNLNKFDEENDCLNIATQKLFEIGFVHTLYI
jgi:hypothetical protein